MIVVDQLALVGLGAMGSSFARAATRQAVAKKIIGYDLCSDVREKARELQITDVVVDTISQAISNADVVFLCSPVSTFQDIVVSAASSFKPGAILSDIGSVKGTVVKEIAKVLPSSVHFVPGHPIAGTEKSGPEAGQEDLFQGRCTILTPEPETDKDSVEKIASIWRRVGALVEFMSAERHDIILAAISHLPHLLAYSAMKTSLSLQSSIEVDFLPFSGAGFRDFTRLAGGQGIIWRDIFINNRTALSDILSKFGDELKTINDMILEGQAEELLVALSAIAEKRKLL